MAEPEYVVFVRLPIPRGDFVDPPQVNWDAAKDEALWKILSGAAQTEIDWNQVAGRFDVPADFLLQQVAYLTERHASQVRAQVRKATAAAKGSSAPSPVPGSDSAAAPGNQRTTSASSLRRESPMPRHDGSGAGTPLHTSARPLMSRNASANTAVLRDSGTSSPRPGAPAAGKAVAGRAGDQDGRRRLSSLPITSTAGKSPEPGQPPPQPESRPEPVRTRTRTRTPSPAAAESSSTASSGDESSPAQSRIIRRPPRFQQQDAGPSYNDGGGDDDGDDDSEPAFQPYKERSNQPSGQTSAQDLASTLKGDGRGSSKRGHRSHKGPAKDAVHASQTSDSSAGSAAVVKRPGKGSRDQRAPGPLSPRRAAELAGRSPSGKSKGYSREGSDGTPSMGSSFSDLDDASVTQSALEEALASHMNRGASSRFSISQAFRSRYTPNSTQ